MAYEVQKIWQRHHEIIRLAVKGLKYKQIAERLDITPQTVSNIMNSDIVKRQVQLIRARRTKEVTDPREEIDELTPKALKVMQEVLDGEEVPLGLKVGVAKDILNRNVKTIQPKVIEGKFTHLGLTAEDVEKIKQRALEAARENGNVIEAEVIEEESKSIH